MTISELISELSAIKRKHGDVDVTYILDSQFQDVSGARVITRDNCPQDLRWCQSGTVAVIDLDPVSK